MAHYIDKDALVAKVEKRKAINEKSYMQAFLNSNDNRDSFGYKVQEDIDILSLIGTLEVKEVQEEPVSEDLEKIPCNHCQGYNNKEKCDELVFTHNCPVVKKPVSEDLEEAAIQYAGKHAPYDDAMDEVEEAFKAGAQWGKNQAMSEIQAQSMALAHGCPKESVSEDLEEAAKQYEEDAVFYAGRNISDFFKAGAQWQKNRMTKNAVDIEYDNLVAYDIIYKICQVLGEGGKGKMIIIKQEEK